MAFIDSGAIINIISPKIIKLIGIRPIKLKQKILVKLFDNTKTTDITYYTGEIDFQIKNRRY
jgi:hypothetical protein